MPTSDLSARIAHLESQIYEISHNVSDWSVAPGAVSVAAAAKAAGLPGTVLYQVPAEYYSKPLAWRAQVLCAPQKSLCKTLLLWNKTGFPDSGDTCSVVPGKPWASSHIAVIVPYRARIDMAALGKVLAAAAKADSSFRGEAPSWTMAERGNELLGFPFNGVAPIGGSTQLPLIIPTAVMELLHDDEMPMPYMWAGGGHPLIKVRLFISALALLVESGAAMVAPVTEWRDGDAQVLLD